MAITDGHLAHLLNQLDSQLLVNRPVAAAEISRQLREYLAKEFNLYRVDQESLKAVTTRGAYLEKENIRLKELIKLMAQNDEFDFKAALEAMEDRACGSQKNSLTTSVSESKNQGYNPNA